MYSEFWGRIAALVMFVGFNLTFFPQFILGTHGMPRRYYDYTACWPRHPDSPTYNVLSTLGAYLLADRPDVIAGLPAGIRCLPAAGRRPIRGARPRWNGSAARRRRTTIFPRRPPVGDPYDFSGTGSYDPAEGRLRPDE